MQHLKPERRSEISSYMTAHLWVAEYIPRTDMWIMSKEPYPYSDGPFEVMAVGKTLEEAFEKAKVQQQNVIPTVTQKQIDETVQQEVDNRLLSLTEAMQHEDILDDELDEQ